MSLRMHLSLTLALSAWLWPGAGVTAQDTAPDASSPAEMRRLWQEMSPEERAQLEENYRRWKGLADEEREQMRQRHERLRRLSGRVEEVLPDEERRRMRELPMRLQHRELERRTRDLLKRSLNLLPEEARRTLREAGPGPGRAERDARFRDQLEGQVRDRMLRMVARLERRGSLEPEESRTLRARLEGLSAGDRFLLVRELLLRDPEAFQVPPETVRRLEQATDPVSVLRLLPELRRWDLPPEGLRRYLQDQEGVEDGDLRELQRWLRGQGVPGREIRRMFEGEESEWRGRLRGLRRRYELPSPPGPFNAPEGRGAPRGRGSGPGRSR